jgi:hypothetical protein
VIDNDGLIFLSAGKTKTTKKTKKGDSVQETNSNEYVITKLTVNILLAIPVNAKHLMKQMRPPILPPPHLLKEKTPQLRRSLCLRRRRNRERYLFFAMQLMSPVYCC